MSVVIRIESVSKGYRLGETDRRALWDSMRRRLIGRESDEGLFWALRDISFNVSEGDAVGILGHNGSGKSTLLKIISHITTPTRGRVLLRGRVASLLEVGTGFHNDLTGRDNTYLNGAILGMTRREVAAKFDEIVEFAQMGEFIDTPVKRYSSGMRVRLAFAVAAHLDPEILIIDEVLAVGDASFQQKCMGKIGEVTGAGRTILFVSHQAAAVESLCTRGVVLDHGQMVFAGTQDAAIRFYSHQIQAAGGSVRERRDRTGTGQVRVTSVDFRVAGERAPAAKSGDDLEVVIGYERTSVNVYPRLTVNLQITTHLGIVVCSQSNWFSGDDLGPLPERGSLVCRIPRLPLVEGLYRFGIGLYPMRRLEEPIDLLQNAAELRVIQGDYFGTGKTPEIRDGAAIVGGSWRLEPATNGST